MGEIDINTGKVNDISDRSHSVKNKGKDLELYANPVRLPSNEKDLFLTYLMLHAIKKLNSKGMRGITRLKNVDGRGIFSIALMGWGFAAYFRLRIKTRDFVLVRTSFGGVTNTRLHESKEFVKDIQKCLVFVEKFLTSQSEMNMKKYPYLPKYNEKGWK